MPNAPTSVPPKWTGPALAAALFVFVTTWGTAADAPTHAAEEVEVECPTVVDVRQDGTLGVQAGRTVPTRPEPWMQQKPCRTESDEVEISGACFLPLERKPPCKSAQYEWGGRCFAAIARQRRPDTSIED